MKTMKMTFYYLPVSPPPSEFCGVDDQGTLYFHPGAISTELMHLADLARVTVFVRIPAGIVPLVSFDWAEEILNEHDLHLLDILKGAFRGFIKSAQPHHYPLADVSLPGDPAFTAALLRILAPNNN
jgi:hypothetical protein